MTGAQKAAVGVSVYLALGTIAAVWTASRNAGGKTSFDGITQKESPAIVLAECVFLWPYAVFRNFVPRGK